MSGALSAGSEVSRPRQFPMDLSCSLQLWTARVNHSDMVTNSIPLPPIFKIGRGVFWLKKVTDDGMSRYIGIAIFSQLYKTAQT